MFWLKTSLVFFLSIFVVFNVHAAEIIRYVNTGASAGGNGTTNDLTGDNAAYVSLFAWEAAEQIDLVTAGNTHTVYVSGSAADTATVTVDWTTDATHYITIACNPALPNSCHSGVWSTSAYRLETSSANSNAFTIQTQAIRLNGWQIKKTSTSTSMRTAIRAQASTSGARLYISNMILQGAVSGSGIATGYRNLGTYNQTYFWNNIIFGFTQSGSYGMTSFGYGATIYAYNNTITNCTNATGFAVDTGTAFRVKNNIVYGCADGYNGTFNSESDYNVSDLASDAPGSNSNNSATVTFSGASDFHLAAADTGAMEKGTDLSADSGWGGATTNDIDNQARSVPWDAGADQYQVSEVTLHNLTLLGVGS